MGLDKGIETATHRDLQVVRVGMLILAAIRAPVLTNSKFLVAALARLGGYGEIKST